MTPTTNVLQRARLAEPAPQLPTGLFHAICHRDKREIEGWARSARPEEVGRVADSLREAPWCALTSRGTVLRTLARWGRTVPPFLLQTCVKDPDLLPRLTRNEALTPSQVDVIGQHVMAVLGKPSWPLHSLTRAVEGICRAGFEIPPTRMEELIRVATEGEASPNALASARFRIPVEDRLAMRAVHILAHVPQLGSPHLAEIVGRVRLPVDLVRRFVVDHPAAGPRVWIAALNSSEGAVSEHAPGLLARHEPAARTPQARELLKRSVDPDILLALLGFPESDTPQLLWRLKTLAPLKLAQLLADGSETIRQAAPRELMVDLLKNPAPQVRVTAFRALGPKTSA
jgi:hypothetical protein